MQAWRSAAGTATGQRYTVVGRLQKRGDRGQQSSAMWTFSYDPI